MRRLILVLILILISSTVMAQELPEPSGVIPTVDLEQDFQIKWGAAGTWTNIVATSIVFSDGTPPGTHTYLGTLGEQTHIAESSDSTVEVPRIATFTFIVDTIPPGHWWGNYYRIRWRCRVEISGVVSQPSVWSKQGYWVAIVSLGQPGRPIH